MNEGLVENKLWAVAKCAGDGTVAMQLRCTCVRTGAGVYTVTLDPAVECDATERIISVQSRTAAQYIVAQDTSDTVITLRGYNAGGAATNTDFDVSITRVVN